MRKIYRVYFVDHYGYYNQKLLQAGSIQDVCDYMHSIGYTTDNIEEVA